MAVKDYYSVLGLDRDATEDEIKRAFRRKARETHPDVADHDGAEAAFKEINEAYEVLSDPDKRRVYDRFGTVNPRGGGPDMGDFFGGGIDMEDVFSAFFGGGFGGFGAQARPRTDGRDMTAAVSVTLEEAAAGARKTLRVTRDAPCPACGGSGMGEGGSAGTCADCGGTGRRRTGRRTFLGVMETVTPCPACSGTGVVIENPCAKCTGSGRARVTEDVTVEIPPGVADGMGIRVRGAGEAGLRGAVSGDLLVTVRVEPHEYLHREGDDLHVRLSVSVAQAGLGASVDVPGLTGDVRVDIPAGTQFGDTVRLRGEGMPKLRGGKGDMIVHVAVTVPRKLSKRQRELLAELGESLGDGKPQASPLQRLRDWLSA